MRRAAARVASRRGSRTTMRPPSSQGSSSRRSGTTVVLPAPGSAWRIAVPASARAARTAGTAGSTGRPVGARSTATAAVFPVAGRAYARSWCIPTTSSTRRRRTTRTGRRPAGSRSPCPSAGCRPSSTRSSAPTRACAPPGRSPGTPRATSRGTPATPRTSGTCPCPTSPSRTSSSRTASATAASSPCPPTSIAYDDPDDGAFAVDLTFEGVLPPNRLGETHLDQPGRYTGHDPPRRRGDRGRQPTACGTGPGGRGRSSGPTSTARARSGAATATPPRSADDGFHAITMDWGDGCIAIHGYLNRDGEYAKVASGTRTVLSRVRRRAHPGRAGAHRRARTAG